MKPFHFKEFSVQQASTALKVGTDAMLLGALVQQTGFEKVGLDIGTGTGVLALMMLQRNAILQMDAVEIDFGAFQDCTSNASNSPWKERMNCIQGNVFELALKPEYDLIICNPPYYENALQGLKTNLNQAKHAGETFLPQLFEMVSQKLSNEGSFWCILPSNNAEEWVKRIEKSGLSLSNFIKIYSKGNNLSRAVLCFTKTNSNPSISELTIRNLDGSYTEEYISLTKDFHGVSLK